jgi:perosamine synthetase
VEPYQELEQQWARWNSLDPAGMVVCSSGTAALHLALEAMQLSAGSKVIVPDFTMIACARAVTLAGLEPVLVDCTEHDLSIDCDLASSAVRKYHQVRAIMPVHIYGRRCPMNKITGIARCEGLYVVEDLAEAHGILPHPDTDAACWSFYKNKIIHGEEGGAVWFRSEERARHARSLRSLGFTEAHDFTHIPRGHNYRMSNAHASLVLDCLDRFPTRAIVDRYRRKHEECMNGEMWFGFTMSAFLPQRPR